METILVLFTNKNQSIHNGSSEITTFIWWENQFYPVTIVMVSVIALGLGIVIKLTTNLAQSLKANQPCSVSVIPSLPSLPLIGPLYALVHKDMASLISSWISTYGYTFKTKIFGKTIVLLSKSIWVQKLLSSNDSGHLKKYPLLYNVMFPGLMKDGLAGTSNIPMWKHHRTISSKAFTLESIKSYLTSFNRHAKQIVGSMSANLHVTENDNKNINCETVGKNKCKTLHQMLHDYTFDTIAEMLIGVDTLSDDDKSAVHRNFSRGQNIISYRLNHPWLVYETIWKFDPKKKEMDNIMACLTEILDKTLDRVSEKSNEEKQVKSVMDFMTSAGLSRTEIFSEVTNFFSAGYDTVSITLNYFLLNMAFHPELQTECRKEIDEIFYALNDNSDEDGQVTMGALCDMKVMENCILESIRLFPSIPTFARELGSQLKIDDDLVLKKGTLVIISPGLVHRDPNVWPEPEKFDPDRFLPENSRIRSSYAYLPFSHGPRNCIGYKVAMAQVKLLASYILRHFEVYTENTYESMKESLSTSIWPSRDLGVCWRKRKEPFVI